MKIFFLLLFLFLFSTPVQAEETIKVMTFNTYTNRLDEVAKYIADVQPNIVAMQELYKKTTEFKTLLDQNGYSMNMRQELDYMAVFSRFKIENYQAFSDSNERKIQTFVISTDNHRLRFFNIHPKTNDPCKANRRLLELAEQFSEPKVLLGDFNMSMQSECYDEFLNNYYDACSCGQEGCRGTVNIDNFNKFHDADWEYDCQTQLIDHVFVARNSNIKVLNAYVDESLDTSDHFPVIAELKAEFIPNCSNISGPSQLTVGEQGSFSADFYSPQGELTGAVFWGEFNRIKLQVFSGNHGTMNFTWSADEPGEYNLYCRAWNDAIAECRPPQFVDGSPRYDCQGPGYQKTIQVAEKPVCETCSSGPAKDQGNADCNSSIDLLDFASWLGVFKTGGSDGKVDFNCSESDSQHIVDLADFRLWLDNFIAEF